MSRTTSAEWLVSGLGLVFSLGLGLAAGCSSSGDPHGACDVLGGPATERAAFGGVDYQVVGGLSGRGDGTAVHVAPDGAVTVQTQQRGTQTGQLDPAGLARVVDAVRAAQFPTLCTTYGCPGCADEYVDQVAVHFDGQVLTTLASQLGDPPDRLQAVIDALRQIADHPPP